MYNPVFRSTVQSSFLEQVPIPTSQPGDSPLVCMSVNQGWVPAVLGALQQLVQPSAWVGTDSQQDAAVDAATDLLAMMGGLVPCGASYGEHVWIAGNDTDIVFRVKTDGSRYGEGFSFADNSQPRGLCKLGANFWVTSPGYPLINVMDFSGAYTLGEIDPAFPVYGLVTVGAGVWACTSASGTGVATYDASGAHLSNIIHSGMTQPIQGAVDGLGNVWIVNQSGSPGAFVFTPAGAFVGSFTPTGSYDLLGCCSVQRGGTTYVWLIDFAQKKVYEMTSGIVLNVTYSLSSLHSPVNGCQVGSNVWIGNADGTVQIVTNAGVASSIITIPHCNQIQAILHVPASP